MNGLEQIFNVIVSLPEVFIRASEETVKYQAMGMFISMPTSIYIGLREYLTEHKIINFEDKK